MKFDQRVIVALVMAFCIGITVGVAGLTLAKQTQPAPITILPPPTLVPTPTLGPITIFVNGEIENEGIYQLPPQSRIEQAIMAAGGFTVDANEVAVNLAQPLHDGMQLYIPSQSEEITEPMVVVSAATGRSGGLPTTSGGGTLLNINVASAEQLDSLPGIGPSTAEKILNYRDESGAFATIEEIMNVPGIGEAKFEQIRELIIVQ